MTNIIFYAVAAVLALIGAVVFFVALVRSRRLRKGCDVLYFAVASVIMLVSLAVGLLAVICNYGIFGLSAVNDGGKLVLALDGNTLFSVPFIGVIASVLTELGLTAVVAPFALLLITLITAITLGAKTFKPKKADKTTVAERRSDADSVSASTEEESTPLSVEDDVPPMLSGEDEAELPPPAETLIESGKVQTIFDEIDKLVTGERPADESDDIDGKLRRAIEEGYKLRDSIENPYEEEPETEEPEEETYEEETDEEAEESEETEEEFAEEEAFEEEAEEDTAAEYEEEYEGETADEPEYEEPSDAGAEELEEEAEEPEEEAEEVAAEVMPEHRVVRSVREQAIPVTATEHVAPNRSERAEEKPPARVRTIIRGQQTREIPKPVEAQSGGLPLTRKYIILNRRNAATVFNEYLNSKREEDREELKGSLNTIIMK